MRTCSSLTERRRQQLQIRWFKNTLCLNLFIYNIWSPLSLCCGTVALNYLSKLEGLQVFLSLIYYTAITTSYSLCAISKHNSHAFRDEKKKESKRVENILSGKLIAWHKNTSYSPTVLLQRLLNPTFKQRSIATSLGEVNGGGGVSFINSGCRSNASTYYSSQLLHLSSNSWLYCSELLGVLNLQQNRRQISSSRVQQLNAFLLLLLLFCFLIRA